MFFYRAISGPKKDVRLSIFVIIWLFHYVHRFFFLFLAKGCEKNVVLNLILVHP